jgi:hypothetical protein
LLGQEAKAFQIIAYILTEKIAVAEQVLAPG